MIPFCVKHSSEIFEKKEERELLAGYWASGNFARTAVAFLPLIPTNPQNTKRAQKTGNLFLSSCFGVPFCMYGGY